MNNQSDSAGQELILNKFGCYGNVILRTGFPVPKSTFQLNCYKIAVFGVCMMLILFILFSNTIFIYGLRKTNKTLTYVQKLFIYLSCIDILGACVPSLMYSVYILNGSSSVSYTHLTLPTICSV